MIIYIYDLNTGRIKYATEVSKIEDLTTNDGVFTGDASGCTHIMDGVPCIARIEPPPTSIEAIKMERDRRLFETDVVYCNAERWSQMNPGQQQAWRDYKQALRDFPATCDQLNPVWPEHPDK